MRLSPLHRDALIQVIDQSLPEVFTAELFLFGSRVDDNKKGGDIDLLWVIPEDRQGWVLGKLASLRAALREAAGDQKVDLTIATPEKLRSDPFLASLGDKLLLKAWRS